LEKLKTMKSRPLLGTLQTLVYYLRFNYSMLPTLNTQLIWITTVLTYFLRRAEPFLRIWRVPASQEIPHFLRHPKVRCRVKCMLRVLILNQINPAHDPPNHFIKIGLNIILPPTPGLSKWSPSSVHIKTLYTPLLSPIHATCHAQLILLDHPNDFWWVHVKLFM
jgi:hypothetical protein